MLLVTKRLNKKITLGCYFKNGLKMKGRLKIDWLHMVSLITYDKFLDCFDSLHRLTLPLKHRHFQFRLLHHKIYLNKIIHSWKMAESSYCKSDCKMLNHLTLSLLRSTIVDFLFVSKMCKITENNRKNQLLSITAVNSISTFASMAA